MANDVEQFQKQSKDKRAARPDRNIVTPGIYGTCSTRSVTRNTDADDRAIVGLGESEKE